MSRGILSRPQLYAEKRSRRMRPEQHPGFGQLRITKNPRESVIQNGGRQSKFPWVED